MIGVIGSVFSCTRSDSEAGVRLFNLRTISKDFR